jgi:ribosome-associated toxin RatA of RatAB toxin-antitoxin module
MPRIESTVIVDLDISTAFKLSQTYGDIRYLWDPFVSEQHLLDNAKHAEKGVRTQTKSKHGLTMISQYTTFKPPHHVGMKMVKGPWFFRSFSGGWNFRETDDNRLEVTWRYNFVCRPAFLRFITHPLGAKLLQRDIDQRLQAFSRACANKEILDQL